MNENAWLAVYCAGILAASVLGGWIPTSIRLTHARMETLISFVAGLMLGVGVLHMLPHALMLRMEDSVDGLHAHDVVDPVMLWLLAGFLVMFFVQRVFHAHHHEAPVDAAHAHDHTCDHHDHRPARRHTWIGACIGLSVHSLMEGVAIAASMEIVRLEGPSAFWIGLSTFLVIVLHKPFDAMSIGMLMTASGQPRARIHIVNAAFALVVPLGIALFHFGLTAASGTSAMLAAALAWSAGTFLCLSMSDLLPELQFHRHDRLKLSAALLSGLLLAWGIGRLEAANHVHADQGHSHGDHHHHDDDHDHQH
jgi:zinc and cadmium transporter